MVEACRVSKKKRRHAMPWRVNRAFRGGTNLGGPRPLGKSHAAYMAVHFCSIGSVQSRDAIGCRGCDRAVGLEIGVQGVDVVDAKSLRGSLLQHGEAVAPDREIVVH